jgi:hypothetical protein
MRRIISKAMPGWTFVFASQFVRSFLLMETGGFLLLESGGKILL